MYLARRMSSSVANAVKQVLRAEGIVVYGRIEDQHTHILTPDALRFVANLHRRFNQTRLDLLARRVARQVEIDAGIFPSFLSVSLLCFHFYSLFIRVHAIRFSTFKAMLSLCLSLIYKIAF